MCSLNRGSLYKTSQSGSLAQFTTHNCVNLSDDKLLVINFRLKPIGRALTALEIGSLAHFGS